MMNRLIWRIKCFFGHHDLEYLPSPPGICGGIFGPCRCRHCKYKHDGFPVPDWSDNFVN